MEYIWNSNFISVRDDEEETAIGTRLLYMGLVCRFTSINCFRLDGEGERYGCVSPVLEAAQR